MTAANLVEHLRHRVEREVKQARAEVEVARADRDAWMQRAMDCEQRARVMSGAVRRTVLLMGLAFAVGVIGGVLTTGRVSARLPCESGVTP